MLRRLPKRAHAALAVTALILLAGFAMWSYSSEGIVAILLNGDASASERVEQVRTYFARFGAAAPLVYVVIVTVEVLVAPLPGLMLYAPGGLIFGGFWGGLLALIGNVLGAGIACELVRALGRARIERVLSTGKLKQYDDRLGGAGIWVILALRINPLTSSDLVSYAAGLTSIPTWKVMVGTLLGMAPLCWAQAYLAQEVLRAFPKLIFPLIVLCVIYGIAATIISFEWIRRTAQTPAPGADNPD